ncbi:TPA: hypothetical protein EYP66_18165 [Candidatus Poribacteria bacterium]|nr:hypothetical protein [Candidatus Poribacteria bacterium]
MATFKCPGSVSFTEPVPELHKCSNCGTEVEMWTDEIMTKCSSCGTSVYRQLNAGWCLRWCAYAKDCIGPEKYEAFIQAGGMSEKEEVRIPQRLKEFMRECKIPIPGEEGKNPPR